MDSPPGDLDSVSAAAGRFAVWVCGELRFESDGRRLDERLRRRQSRELLALLVLERDRRLRREELVEWFWPESPPGTKDVSLRVLLSDLRGALGADLLQSRPDLRLDLPSGTWIDIEAAASALSDARTALAEERLADAQACATEACELTERELLEGLSPAWVLERRRAIEELALEALECLATASLQLPDQQRTAQAAARRMVARAPFRELGYALLMQALAAQGNAAEALLEYERLRVLLRDELGTVPSAPTARVHAQLLETEAAGAATNRGGNDAAQREPHEASNEAPRTLSRGYLAFRQAPRTRYTQRPDGVNIGYQELGTGPASIVLCWGWISHLDLNWTDPGITRLFKRLASFSRLVLYDKPGTGVSDPISHIPTLEERGDDIRAVMDAAGLERATILGDSEASAAAALFAAAHPDRTDALIIYGSLASGRPRDQDLAAFGGQPGETARLVQRLEHVLDHWGEGQTADLIYPSIATPIVRRAAGTFERASVSPAMARGLIDALLETDVTSALSAISVPTLVLHKTDDSFVPIAHGRLLADRIPMARLTEVPGTDHAIWTQSSELIISEIEQFVTATRPRPSIERALATVMIVDAVAPDVSEAPESDYASWQGLLEHRDDLLAAEVPKTGGTLVRSRGDSALVTFPAPARAITCAHAIQHESSRLGLPLRIGLHTGECQLIAAEPHGLAVQIATQIVTLAQPGETLVSTLIVDLTVGSGLQYVPRGERDLHGLPGRWEIYALAPQKDIQRVAVEPARPQMTHGDRASVQLARRAPRAIRAIGRLAQHTKRAQETPPPD